MISLFVLLKFDFLGLKQGFVFLKFFYKQVKFFLCLPYDLMALFQFNLYLIYLDH